MILSAIQNRDYFLLQGIFLFIIVGRTDRELHRRHRLRASIDPRTRLGMQGSA